jgi:uncharacterized protein YjbJ (UPF0337 family)
VTHIGEKIKGEAAVVGGAIEKTVGKVLQDEKMTAAGAAHEAEGKARLAAEAAKPVAAAPTDSVTKKA